MLWRLGRYCRSRWLGRFHEEVGRIIDQLGRPIRRHGGNRKGKDYSQVLPIT